ncbi:MAG TPA: hypothetical protein VND94_08605 [Terriglobia bacterium]|nr:hypothetical protein [Terriglobia bacterium]
MKTFTFLAGLASMASLQDGNAVLDYARRATRNEVAYACGQSPEG